MLYVLTLLAGFILGTFVCFRLMWKLAIRVAQNKDQRIQMFRSYFYTLDRWLTAKRRQKALGDWLAQTRQVHTVALYGLGVLGRQFAAELEGSPVKILYAIDRDTTKTSVDFPVLKMEEILPPVELVIVTPAYDFDIIRDKLKVKLACPIIQAEMLIKEFYQDGTQF